MAFLHGAFHMHALAADMPAACPPAALPPCRQLSSAWPTTKPTWPSLSASILLCSRPELPVLSCTMVRGHAWRVGSKLAVGAAGTEHVHSATDSSAVLVSSAGRHLPWVPCPANATQHAEPTAAHPLGRRRPFACAGLWA